MFRLLTFAAFGGLGYAAYSFYQKNGRVPNVYELADTVKTLISPQDDTPQPEHGDLTSLPVAGGSLSRDATLQTDPNEPPANDPYSGSNVPPPAG
jgi:hypothetical protein